MRGGGTVVPDPQIQDFDNDEEVMEGKRRDAEDIQDSLVVQEGMIVKFPLVPVVIFASPALRFFPARRSSRRRSSFQQEEVQPYSRDTHRPNIMNYLVTPKAPDHLPLATLLCLPEQCNHCGKNF